MPKKYDSMTLEQLEAEEQRLIGEQQRLSNERDAALRTHVIPIRKQARKVQAQLDVIASARVLAQMSDVERDALKQALGVSG